MEAKKRLLGLGCVGLGVVVTVATAAWHMAPPRLQAAQNGEGNTASAGEAAVAPSPPPIRTDIRTSRAGVPTGVVKPALPAAPAPPTHGGQRLAKSSELSQANSLRKEKEPAEPTYPATGQSAVSQVALLRASDAQPGGPETMLDGNLLLIEAHEVAEAAETVPELSRVIELCQAGIQAGVGSDAVQFAHDLMSWTYNRRGEERDRLGDAKQALVDFNAAVEHDPTRWQAVHNRGVSLAQAGRMGEALADFSRTIQLQPRYAKAYSNRAAIQERQGKLREALQDFQRAVELDQTLAAAHAGMGRMLFQVNRSQEALLALDEALQIDAENPAYLTSRGDVFAGLGEYEAALTDYGKAIEVDPSFATAYRNGSWLLATCPDDRYRDPENALIGAEKALDLAHSERHLSLDTLAAAHANAGEFDQAVQIAQQAIEEAPQGLRNFYATRLKMYQEQRPYRTQAVQQAAFVDPVGN